MSDTNNNNNNMFWTRHICCSTFPIDPNSKQPPFSIGGGSENASFLLVCHSTSPSNQQDEHSNSTVDDQINENDIILEIQGRKLSGLTSYDAQKFLNQCCNKDENVVVKFVKAGHLNNNLRLFLSQSALDISASEFNRELQSVVRDNNVALLLEVNV
uniref:PDZ domain-containing protein n=1 Tax=Romanomermis culicivorax TaxID=13658 RepID=A0A915K3A3_ROMCU